MTVVSAQQKPDAATFNGSLGEVAHTLNAGNRALRELLFPLEPGQFAAQYWERQPFYSEGAATRTAGFAFDVRKFWSLAEQAGVKLKATGEDGGVGLSVVQARALFAAGQTVVIDDIDALFPPARALSVLAKAGLGHVGATSVNCYLSPCGGGYGLHFDQHSVLLLQLSGAKTWRYGRMPAVESPDEHWVDLPQSDRHRPSWARQLTPPDEDALETTTLRPGGVLYLPSGTWHRGRAEGHSLAFTLTFGPARFGRLLQSLVTRKQRDNARFRHYIPLRSEPDTRREFLAARLREARELLESVTVDELLNLSDECVHSFGLPELPRAETTELCPDDRLSPPEWFGTTVASNDETLHLFYLNKKVTLPTSAQPFVERLLSQTTTFVAKEACTWVSDDDALSWDEVRPALQMFVSRGFLSRVANSTGVER